MEALSDSPKKASTQVVASIDEILGARSEPYEIDKKMQPYVAMIAHAVPAEVAFDQQDGKPGYPNNDDNLHNLFPAQHMQRSYGKALMHVDGSKNAFGFKHLKPFHHVASKSLALNSAYKKLACIITHVDQFRVISYKATDKTTGAVTVSKFAQLTDCVGPDNTIIGNS